MMIFRKNFLYILNMKYLKNINEAIDNKELVMIEGDDWEGLYKDGELIDQGHRLEVKNVLRGLGYKIDATYLEENEWEAIGNSCPRTLDEVKMKLNAKKYNL